MKPKIKCPVCSGRNVKIFLQVTGGVVYACGDCEVRFVFPSPSPADLNKYYKEGYFEGGKEGVRGYKDYAALENNLETEAVLKLDLIQKRIKKGKLLDVGAGTGVFADKAKKLGFSVYANDISPFAAKALKKRNIECFLGPVNKKILPVATFDVVTAWDVVEHVSEINEMIDAVAHTLKDQGLFLLTTPDTGSWDARIMGKNWYGYKKIPEHLLFFNRTSIKKLLNNNNFDVVEIKRWGFYRDLNFIIDKLQEYDNSFAFGRRLLGNFSLGGASLFFPLTDFLVVAQKRGGG